jgi:hypothetical protein
MPALEYGRHTQDDAALRRREADLQDLKDVLHDVADEYAAAGCPLSTFTFEVGTILMALEHCGDPAWMARLGEEWQRLRVVRAEQFAAGAIELSAAQLATTSDVARRVQQLADE